jgi:predicted dithiol-disulfide oxidoreductase (DUF899 family)
MNFPNETSEYRAARKALLASEVALRRQMEAVAAQLRTLPPGGEVPADYAFDAADTGGGSTVIRMSELFRGGDTLMIYHYMFPRHSADERPGPTAGVMANVPLAEGPCPSCTALIDMWDGTALDPVRSHACRTPGGRRADGLPVLSRSASRRDDTA